MGLNHGDSIHLIGTEQPDNIDIDDNRLGAWKCEGIFRDSKFIRAKTYMEEHQQDDGSWKWDIKCAGMPKEAKKHVTKANFKEGAIFDGKLVPRQAVGGVYLKETEFTIKRTKI